MPDFIPGLELNRRCYKQVVRPLLDREFPGLRYAAARIGYGSDVLGFDTPMSTDHDWGVRFTLFVPDVDARIGRTLARELPHSFLGYPVSFSAPNADDHGTQTLAATDAGPVNHAIEVMTLGAFTRSYLGIEPDDEPSIAQWLTMPSQVLRGATAGAVFHDGVGELTRLRERLAFYPNDVWLYLMAAEWQRIGQEEHFVGRTADVGDEVGTRLVAARLVHDTMRLSFLQERVYAPYSKWFGSAFKQLRCADSLVPLFESMLRADTRETREPAFVNALEQIAASHNALNLTTPLRTTAVPFFTRPYRVLFAGRFADALIAQIRTPELRRIAERTRIGGVNQFTTNSDLLESVEVRGRLQGVFEGW